MKKEELKEIYEDFMNKNYYTQNRMSIYHQMVEAYAYLNHPIGVVDKEELKKEFLIEVHKRVETDPEFSLLRNYFTIAKIDSYPNRVRKMDELGLTDHYATYLVNDKIKKIFPNKKFISKTEYYNALECVKYRELMDILLEFSSSKNDDIGPIKDYLLKHKSIDTVIMDIITMRCDINIYTKLGKAVSKLDPEQLLDFLMDNGITITERFVPGAYISNPDISLIITNAVNTGVKERVDKAKQTLLLFIGGDEEKIEVYKSFPPSYYYSPNINKLTWIYLKTKLKLDVEYEKVYSIVREQYRKVGEQFNLREQVENIKEIAEDKISLEEINNAKKILIKYLEEYEQTGILLDKFSSNMQMNPEECRRQFRLLKDVEPDLYNKYLAIGEINSKKAFSTLMNISKSLIDGIINGVEEADGSIRQFDVIDYYQRCMFPMDKIRDFVSKANEISNSGKAALYRFIAKNKNMTLIKPQVIRNMEIYLGGRIESGKIVGGRVMSEEEKEMIFNFLKENRVPLTMYTFNLAKDRLLKSNKTNNAKR